MARGSSVIAVLIGALVASAAGRHVQAERGFDFSNIGVYVQCAQDEFSDVGNLTSEIAAIESVVVSLYEEIVTEFENCPEGIIEKPLCQAKVLKKVISDLSELKTDVSDVLPEVKEDWQKFQDCVAKNIAAKTEVDLFSSANLHFQRSLALPDFSLYFQCATAAADDVSSLFSEVYEIAQEVLTLYSSITSQVQGCPNGLFEMPECLMEILTKAASEAKELKDQLSTVIPETTKAVQKFESCISGTTA